MISSLYPFPQKCGFTVRLRDLCEQLTEYFDIHLLVYNSNNSNDLSRVDVFSKVTFFKPVVYKKTVFTKIKNRLNPLYFDDPSYMPDVFVEKVLELNEENNYDICMIHTLIFACCINALPNSIFKVVDTHDIWYQKYTEFDKIGSGKLLYQYRDKKHELDFYKKMDLVIGISLWDQEYLQNNGVQNSIYVPVSFKIQSIKKDKPFNNEILYPAGKGQNNIDAIDYFIKAVLPLVKKEIPDVKFKILNPCEEIKEKYSSSPNVVFLPFQENIIDAYKQTDIVVIPLRVKSGLKIKLLESFSYGVPTILTSATAQGIELDGYPQKNYSIEPATFAHEIIKTLSSHEYRQSLSEKALDLIEKYYSPEAVYSELIKRLLHVGQSL